MSGDVQPRKRKDKKKKREDDETKEQHQGVHQTKMGEDDIHLHVHSDHGTGGHWCAKIFFFALLAILIGLTGIIILENQGESDVDTPLSESRFSNYFEGWVDEHRQDDHHDAHDDVIESIEDHEDEHGSEPFEEEEDHSELEESHDHDDEEDEDHDGDNDDEDDHDDEEDEENATEEGVTQEEDDEDQDDEENTQEDDGTHEDDNDDEDATQEDDNEATQEDDEATAEDDEATAEDNDEDDGNTNEDEDDDIFDEHEPSHAEFTKDAPLETIEIEETSRSFEEIYVPVEEQVVPIQEKDSLPDSVEEQAQESVEKDASQESFEEQVAQEHVEEHVVPEVQESYHSEPPVPLTESPEPIQTDDDEEDDDDDVVDESNPKVVDNDAEELALLQEKAKQQEDEDGDDDDDEDDNGGNDTSSRVRGGAQNFDDDDEDDDIFEREFRRAEEHLARQKYQEAFKIFDRLTTQHPDRPKAFLGKAKTLDVLAELHQSNEYLREAIKEFKRFLAFEEELEDEEFLNASQRCAERMKFLGNYMDAVNVQKSLVERFPNVSDYRNQLAISYLSVNRLPEAKRVLHETLLKWRKNGIALVHYGFVCKALDNNCTTAVMYLKEGIESEEEGTQDGRFYFSLGECLQRLGRFDEAKQVFKSGAEKKIFLSEYQRSLYNIQNLKAQPFWTKEDTTYTKALNELEKNWEIIRDEGLNALKAKGLFQNEAENLRDFGDWKQFDLFIRGIKNKENCAKTPITCGIIDSFPEAKSCKRGQVKFSVMHPGTHVWPHCGPTNCRLRAHLGLVVPEGTKIRVAEEERSWEEGKLLIFDDSFEHEVWHKGSTLRLVLIVDIWHPDLTKEQRLSLSPI